MRWKGRGVLRAGAFNSVLAIIARKARESTKTSVLQRVEFRGVRHDASERARARVSFKTFHVTSLLYCFMDGGNDEGA